MAENTNITQKNNDYIPLKEKILYGSAEFYGGGSATLISILLLAFLNKVLGIEAVIASSIIMASKAWDAISDPLMGAISDNTRSKWGRRKPYLILGGILTFFAMLCLFAPIASFPMWFKISFAAFSYIFFCTANTISQVPYCSLSSDISPDFKERNNANTIKLFFSMLGAAVCFLVPSKVLEKFLNLEINSITFYLIIGVGFGLLFAIPIILAGIYTKERTPYDKDHKTKFSFKNYKSPFTIKCFRQHLLMYIGAFLCVDIIAALAVYYTADVLRDTTIFGREMSMLYVIAPMMVMAGLMIPLVVYISRKKSKQFAYRVGLPCYIIGGLFLAFMPSSFPGWCVPIATIVMGIGLGGAQSMPWIIFPDTIDVAEMKLGERSTGSFSGIMTLLRKMSTAIAIGLVGLFLSLAGQIPGIEGQPQPVQPDSVLITIRILMGTSIVLLIGMGFYASLKYKVTDDKLKRVRYFLEHQRNNTLDKLTDEEIEERANLIIELAGEIKELKPKKIINNGLKQEYVNNYNVFTKTKEQDFRILQLTDLHIGSGFLSLKKDILAMNDIIRVVEYTKPDLIILTGDNIYPIPFSSGAINNMRMSKKVGKLFESFEIPWALVFGNHDVEPFSTHSKEKLADYYRSLPHCIFEKGPENISGLGNYIIKVNNSDNTLNTALVLMDSNMYITKNFFSGFDNIHDDQIEWYKSEINKLSREKGSIVPSLAFFHIPCTEYKEAWRKFTSGSSEVTYHFGEVGEINDYFGIPKVKGNIFNEMVKLNSTKGIFVGHDHLNNVSMTYKGIRLTYGMSIDRLAYWKINKYTSQRGGTLVSIADDSSFKVEHIKLDDILSK